MRKQIHHFFWWKSAQDTGSFENGNYSSEKKMAYMILRVLQASDVKKKYIITKEFYNYKQRNQTVIFISSKIFPQCNQQKCCTCLCKVNFS